MSKSSQLLAIGIALRLPSSHESNCRWLSQKFDLPYLDLLDPLHIPHVTLIQMIVQRKDLNKIQEIISGWLINSLNLNINPEGFIPCGQWGDEECWGLKIDDETNTLSRLSKDLYKQLACYNHYSDNLSLNEIGFFEPVTNKEILNYIKDFPKRLQQDYNPHITLGFLPKGKSPEKMGLDLMAEPFQVNQIELFHLGNYGALCPMYFKQEEIYVSHRINTINELENVPAEYGIELDIRDSPDRTLRIVHDSGLPGEDFEEYIKTFKHEWLILNIKSERIEFQILPILNKFNITNYFFLDSSFPMIYQLAIRGTCPQFAIRFSEFEPLEMAQRLAGKIKWVWVDCFTRFPLTRSAYLKLREWGYKICLVSPELHGYPDKLINQFIKKMEGDQVYFDMVCTKSRNIDTWVNK